MRIFTWDGAAWNQRGPDIDGMVENGYSGRISMSGDGSILAIGASSVANPDGDSRAGICRVWGWADDAWHQIGASLYGVDTDDFFGSYNALSADGKTLAVGAPIHDSERGHLQIFELDETADSAGDSGNSVFGDIGDGNSNDGGVAADAAGFTLGENELSQKDSCAKEHKTKRKCKRAAGCKWKRKKKKCRARAK